MRLGKFGLISAAYTTSPLCIYDTDVGLSSKKRTLKQVFSLENSVHVSVAQSMWVATSLPSHLHLKSIWGHLFVLAASTCLQTVLFQLHFELNPLQKHDFILSAFNHVLSFCSVSRSVSIQSQAVAMCGQVVRSEELDDLSDQTLKQK